MADDSHFVCGHNALRPGLAERGVCSLFWVSIAEVCANLKTLNLSTES
jgi:hypothetical protein